MLKIISCCMLLLAPDRPPMATPVPASGANMGNQGWTYLGEMKSREFHTRFGRNLCYLVRECCMHMPGDRPGLNALKARTTAGVAANPVTKDDRRWIRRTLCGPTGPFPVYEPSTVGLGQVVTPFPW